MVVDERPAHAPGDDHATDGSCARDQEPAAGPLRAREGHNGIVGHARPSGRGRDAEQYEQGRDAGDHRDRGIGDGERRRGQRIAKPGGGGKKPERGEDRHPQPAPSGCQDAGSHGDYERHHEDEEIEGELVVRPEQVDDELLGARWLEADDERADRRDQRRRTGHEACAELRHRDGDAGPERARDGGSPPAGRHRERPAHPTPGSGPRARSPTVCHGTTLGQDCDGPMSAAR